MAFKQLTNEILHRLFMDVRGLEGTGKTTFALTGPSPIAYINIDYGGTQALQRAVAAGKRVDVEHIPGVDTAFTSDIEVKSQARASVRAAFDAYRDALASNYRTIIIDDCSGLWDAYQLNQFGRLSGNSQRSYGELNLGFAQLLRKGLEASNKDKSVITISKCTDNWENVESYTESGKKTLVSKRTGTYRRDGWKNMNYLVDLELIANCRNGEYSIEFGEKIRHDKTEYRGMELYAPDNTFPVVASMIVDGTTPEDWT